MRYLLIIGIILTISGTLMLIGCEQDKGYTVENVYRNATTGQFMSKPKGE